MKIFVHRANLNGPGTGDNRLEAIEACLEKGFGVEMDLLGVNGQLWIGHDEPAWKIEPELLKHEGVICHAKNIEAAILLSRTGANFFCLDRDDFALCSNGWLWTNYGSQPTPLSIMCSPELVGASENIEEFYARIKGCHGICTDYPLNYELLIKQNP